MPRSGKEPKKKSFPLQQKLRVAEKATRSFKKTKSARNNHHH